MALMLGIQGTNLEVLRETTRMSGGEVFGGEVVPFAPGG